MPSNSAKDLVPKKDSDKEVTEFEPRSSGEKKFRDSHTVSKTNHPVATDTQHKGSTDHGGEHKGYDGVPGERNADMKTFDQFRKMGGHGKSSYRSNDKSAGEKSPVMQGSSKVKEEVDIEENYTAGHEKSKFGGYRAKVTNKDGKTSYLGSTSYHNKKHAEGEAKIYSDNYKSDPNGHRSQRAVSSYVSKAKQSGHVREEIEEEMSDSQMKKREDYVKGMKKNLAGFKAKYGDRAKEVMYATATKMAKK